MGGFSLIHWIILGVVILLLFGGNRFSAMMGDVAKGLKSFKHGMAEEDQPPRTAETRAPEPRALPREAAIDLAAQPVPPAQRPADPAAAPIIPSSGDSDDVSRA